jgi:zinc/manganese transport system permease protein
MVLAFAAVLILAAAVRVFIAAPSDERSRNRRLGLRAAAFITCIVLGLSGLWVIVAPAGDHPLLAAIELGIGPQRFMTARDRADYFDAVSTERRQERESDRLTGVERQSRWQGEPLGADDIRRIASLQQTLTEMRRGERFVMDYLRIRARERERWYVGVPLAALGFLGIALMIWQRRQPA